MKNQLVITGIGMVSAIGHDVETSCSSFRAGIVRPSDLPFLILDESEVEEVPVVGYSIPRISAGYEGVALYLRIASFALNDLLRNGNLFDMPGSFWQNTGLFICISVTRNDPAGIIDELIVSELPNKIISSIFPALPINQCWIIQTGHASVIQAVSQAKNYIAERIIKNAVVLGIDSLTNEASVEYYHDLGCIKTIHNITGFIPGEAGASFFIETEQDAIKRAACIKATVGQCATGFEKHRLTDEFIKSGRSLAEVMINVMKDNEDINTVYCDLNGENSRAVEWGNALLNVKYHLKTLPDNTILPAECFGDTGAASGAIAICAAVQSYQRNYALSKSTLICSRSEEGNVAAMIISQY